MSRFRESCVMWALVAVLLIGVALIVKGVIG